MLTQTQRIMALASLLGLCGSAWADYTNNILITGYWPQTNNMLRQFSTNTGQNPSGWAGGNWEGRGWNVHSYFPEFPGGPGPGGDWGPGVGDFRVDYRDTHDDWLRIVDDIKPAAIITFSRGGFGSNWEIEGRLRMWEPNQWIPDYRPARPTADMAIFDDMAPGFYDSALPTQLIAQAVQDANVVDQVFIDTAGAGRYLSEFIGMHGLWYHQQNSGEDAPYRSFAAGHIHVGIDTPLLAAELATEATLRALTEYLNNVVPAPSTVGVLALGGLLAARRKRG